MNNSTETQQSVISILKSENKLKAVELTKQNGTFSILWAKSSNENDLDWHSFGQECGISTKSILHDQTVNNKHLVVGYDSTGTAFYRVNVPEVEEKEISDIVYFQAESRFMLPADQMELAWRTSKLPNKQMGITIAAAKKQTVQNFIDKVRPLHPSKAILDSEAIVKVWQELFSGREQDAIIVNAGTHNTQICLTEKGLLCTAVTLDIGTVDFGESESQDDTEMIERLVRDIRSVVELFGLEKQFEIPVIVLSDGSKIYRTLAASLKTVGLNARSSTPSMKKLDPHDKLDSIELFEYRASIGLAMMALDIKTQELNLFSYLFESHDKKVKTNWLRHPKLTSIAAIIMVTLFIMVSYAEIATGSRTINSKLSNLGSDTEINNLVDKQKLYKEVARQRADLLVLLDKITCSGQGISSPENNPRTSDTQEPNSQPKTPPNSGIQLESFQFKKGKQVTLTGKAQKKEQLEDFEKCLLSNNDITNVHLTPKSQNGSSSRSTTQKSNGRNPAPQSSGGSGKKGFGFTITFNYKDFSVSKRR